MKRIITMALAVFVVYAIISPFAKNEEVKPERKPVKASYVYYMHGEQRCPTCNKLESYAKETIETDFAKASQNGKLYWESANYTTPKYEHFVKEFNLSFQMIVLVRYEDGKIVRHQKLEKIWDLVDDKAQYQAYVKDEINKFFGELIK